jgi:hypothetical protein
LGDTQFGILFVFADFLYAQFEMVAVGMTKQCCLNSTTGKGH